VLEVEEEVVEEVVEQEGLLMVMVVMPTLHLQSQHLLRRQLHP